MDLKNTSLKPEDNSIVKYDIEELLFKFIFVGDFGVGKTSLIKRYSEGTFSSNYKITIGADFAIKTRNYQDNTTINIQLWDIAGHERFGYLTSVYYRYAVAAAIVFDLTRPETYLSLKKWIFDVRDKVRLSNGEDIPIVLLANKGDVTLDTIPSDIDVFCKSNNITQWFITSAKESLNIDEAMDILINQAYLNHKKSNITRNAAITIDLDEKDENNKRSCCF